MTIEVRSYGAEALLVQLDSTELATALHARLVTQPPLGAVETMPGLQTVLVRFDPTVTEAVAMARRVADLASDVTADDAAPAAERLDVRVAYDGADLDEVAERTGLTAADVVTAHQAPTYRVALIGMAPGFYFLAGGDARLQVPRRTSPRPEVPRGAVGLAGAYTGIYPKRGPGGWQLIGRVLDELWHADRFPGAALSLGTTVRFVAA